MKKIVLVASSIACLLGSVAITPPQARAESCGDLARKGEVAYNNFQYADNRGDEMQMAYHYVDFQLQVAKFREKGCR